MQQWITAITERFCDRLIHVLNRGFTNRDGRENVVDGLFAIATSLNKVAEAIRECKPAGAPRNG